MSRQSTHIGKTATTMNSSPLPDLVTLIANPEYPVLSGDLVMDICRKLGATKPTWLAPGIACDIAIDAGNEFHHRTKNILRDMLEGLAVDIVLQNTKFRRKRALIADMDSTMIEQECIDELAAIAGIKDQVATITARAMNGEIEFEASLHQRLALLKGLNVSVVERVFNERITFTQGGRELVATMKKNHGWCALVSGGFTAFTNLVAAKLGFDEHHANILLEKDGFLTGRAAQPILGRQAKVEALNKIAAQQSLNVEDFIAVGDGANDLGMLNLAGTGVALHAKPNVASQADIRIDHGDLTALLYIQGYKHIEFRQ